MPILLIARIVPFSTLKISEPANNSLSPLLSTAKEGSPNTFERVTLSKNNSS